MEYYSITKKNEIVICRKMDGTGDHHVNKPYLERQIIHVLSHMLSLDLKTNNQAKSHEVKRGIQRR
jgi:hypothetical protein